MGYEKDLLTISINNMDRCLNRIEYYRRLKIEHKANKEIKNLIDKEIKNLILEYSNTYQNLKKYSNYSQGIDYRLPLNDTDDLDVPFDEYLPERNSEQDEFENSGQITNKLKSVKEHTNSSINEYIKGYISNKTPIPKNYATKNEIELSNSSIKISEIEDIVVTLLSKHSQIGNIKSDSIRTRDNPKIDYTCLSCGASIPLGNFCLNCGIDIKTDQTESNKESNLLDKNIEEIVFTKPKNSNKNIRKYEDDLINNTNSVINSNKSISKNINISNNIEKPEQKIEVAVDNNIVDIKSNSEKIISNNVNFTNKTTISIPEKFFSYLKMEVIPNSPMANAFGLLSITIGGALTSGALFLLLIPLIFPSKVSGLNTASQIMVNLLDIIPGIPFPINDLLSYDLFTISIVSIVLSINLILLGLGLLRKSNIARQATTIIFVLSIAFDLILFITQGFLKASYSLIGLGLNTIMLYLLLKNKFWK